jgi:hypothetical protein
MAIREGLLRAPSDAKLEIMTAPARRSLTPCRAAAMPCTINACDQLSCPRHLSKPDAMHAPNGVAHIIRHQQSAMTIQGHANRPTTCLPTNAPAVNGGGRPLWVVIASPREAVRALSA